MRAAAAGCCQSFVVIGTCQSADACGVAVHPLLATFHGFSSGKGLAQACLPMWLSTSCSSPRCTVLPVQDEKPAAKPAAKAAAKPAAKKEESDDDDDDSDDDDEDDSEVSGRGVGKVWKLREGCWGEGRG